MKKKILNFIALIIAVLLPITVMAETENESESPVKEKVNVYLFWGNGCGYCEAAKDFFASIEDEYGKYFELVEYEVWYSKDNNALKERVVEYFGDDVSGVPYIVIGDTTFGGYASSYDEDIKEAIKDAYEDEKYVDYVEQIISGDVETPKNYDTLIVIGIFVVIIGGFGALIYFSRKS